MVIESRLLQTNVDQIRKNISKRIDDLQRDSEIAQVRALNATARKGKIKLARDLSVELGVTVRSAKKAIQITFATKTNKRVSFFISGARIPLIKPTLISRKKRGVGIRFRGINKKKEEIRNRIRGGSLPFLIDAKEGGEVGGVNVGKKIAVFRERGSRRKVTTLKWYSIPEYSRIKYEEDLEQFMVENLQKEYLNALKRISYIKRR